MINVTLFDALLMTLWAAVTALGVRRGLGGVIWGALGVAVCFMVNMISKYGLTGFVAALALGAGAVLVSRRLIREPLTEPWHLAAGGVGGFLLGGVLVGAVALGFPIKDLGDHLQYPSTDLPGSLYDAVSHSYIRQQLDGVLNQQASLALRTLLVPDQLHKLAR